MNLYFECNMGAAGDMIASALVDLFENKEKTVEELNGLGLPNTLIKYSEKKLNGLSAPHLSVIIDGKEETPDSHTHAHRHGRSLGEVFEIIDSLSVSDSVKSDAKNIYKIIAEAEAKAHNAEAGEVHFHELGMLDAIADVTMAAFLMDKLKPERVICSPVNVGSSSVKCAHGILPVPVPAVVNIFEGVPYYKSGVDGELCTPTGAAILKYYADEFTKEPHFENVIKVGTGAGTKKFEEANVIRVFEFEGGGEIVELSCNIDDMTGEETGFAAERIMENGALDCFISPIIMKKGRPAYMFTVLCKTGDEEKFAGLIFKHTATTGIRKYTPSRYTLDREIIDKGVSIKRSEGFGTVKEKAEFEELKKIAVEKDISLFEARKDIEKGT